MRGVTDRATATEVAAGLLPCRIAFLIAEGGREEIKESAKAAPVSALSGSHSSTRKRWSKTDRCTHCRPEGRAGILRGLRHFGITFKIDASSEVSIASSSGNAPFIHFRTLRVTRFNSPSSWTGLS